jgi:hypothetical protein
MYRRAQVGKSGFRFTLGKKNQAQKVLGLGIVWIALYDLFECFASFHKVSTF